MGNKRVFLALFIDICPTNLKKQRVFWRLPKRDFGKKIACDWSGPTRSGFPEQTAVRGILHGNLRRKKNRKHSIVF